VPGPRAHARWWIVDADDDALPDDVDFAEWHLEHIFLKTRDGSESRVTRKSQPGLTTYHHRVQGALVDGEQAVHERTLSLREFRALAKNADPARASIRKTRRAFLWDNEYYLLDTFVAPKSAAGTQTLFVESEKRDAAPPPFLRLVEDVTTTKWFSSHDDDYGRTMALAEEVTGRRHP